jgi:hypothetical protein
VLPSNLYQNITGSWWKAFGNTNCNIRWFLWYLNTNLLKLTTYCDHLSINVRENDHNHTYSLVCLSCQCVFYELELTYFSRGNLCIFVNFITKNLSIVFCSRTTSSNLIICWLVQKNSISIQKIHLFVYTRISPILTPLMNILQTYAF